MSVKLCSYNQETYMEVRKWLSFFIAVCKIFHILKHYKNSRSYGNIQVKCIFVEDSFTLKASEFDWYFFMIHHLVFLALASPVRAHFAPLL